MARDKKSGLESELLSRRPGRVRAEKPQSTADKLMANLEAQRQKAADMAAKPKMYVVEAGDSLSVIAKKIYGDAGRWQDIFEANKETLKDPNMIRVGQELVIPD